MKESTVSKNYWTKTLAARIGRRRLLRTAGAGAAAAAFLAACGGDDNGGSGEPKDASGLLAKVEDTTKDAKPGGVWVNPLTSDVLNMDPYGVTIGSAHAPWGYSRMVIYRPARYPDTPQGEVDPDGAESWEMSPDGLRFTFKLRSNLKLDPRPPTNGRILNARDVVFSAEKFKATGVSRGEFFNSLSPNSPVDTVEATDDRTVVVKMAFPMANMMSRFAFQRYLWLMPAEADGRFDPKAEMRGSGAWRLDRWEPSIGMKYSRNPDWHLKPPFFDQMEMPIVSEYAQRRAQFIAGNVAAFAPGTMAQVPSDEILPIKREQPKLNLYADTFPDARPAMVSFGLQENSPFLDTRVRRAVSMLIDRETFIDVFYNVSVYESEGLPVESRWHSHFAAGEPPYWIDPKGNGLGEGAQYFKFNPDEAKKLMQAAGHNAPLSMQAHVSAGATQTSLRQQEAIHEMLQQGNMFQLAINSVPTNEFNIRYFNGGGLYDGIVLSQGPGVSGDIDNHITVRFNVKANPPQSLFRTVHPWYEKIQSLIEAQRVELDEKKRATILADLQKEMALQMPAVPWPGIASGFSLAWPFMGNYNLYTAKSSITAPSETWQTYWYDESKRV
jgi:ABC-type transport system substrate-binding protein